MLAIQGKVASVVEEVIAQIQEDDLIYLNGLTLSHALLLH